MAVLRVREISGDALIVVILFISPSCKLPLSLRVIDLCYEEAILAFTASRCTLVRSSAESAANSRDLQPLLKPENTSSFGIERLDSSPEWQKMQGKR
jgi:hypothetical protein